MLRKARSAVIASCLLFVGSVAAAARRAGRLSGPGGTGGTGGATDDEEAHRRQPLTSSRAPAIRRLVFARLVAHESYPAFAPFGRRMALARTPDFDWNGEPHRPLPAAIAARLRSLRTAASSLRHTLTAKAAEQVALP